MRTVNEQEITMAAPNLNAVANARKISSTGGFVVRKRSADDTFYMGECKGSGKNNYVVSVDYIDDASPVFRCSCPSRQFPCKHSLALLFEMAAGKEFEICEIPQDILDKREKKDVREAKKQAGDVKKPASERSAKAAKAARAKKIRKQLEGLALLKQLTDQLMNWGLASMGSGSLMNYRNLAKQLGDYYLPGPLVYLNRLILEMEKYQKDQNPVHYSRCVEILKKLRALEKKAVVYLNDKLETDSPEADDDELYEELGGIWKLEQLNGLGLKKENARLLQLSFQVDYDQARKEYMDLAYWVELDTGEICHTCNYRPVKALKYVRQEDSCFGVMTVPVLSCYPGHGDRRVRWSGGTLKEAGEDAYRDVMGKAFPDLLSASKEVKNQIKNILADDFCPVLVSFKEIGTVTGMTGVCLAVMDRAGSRMELRSREPWQDTVSMVPLLTDSSWLQGGVLFGLMYYDPDKRQMCIHPCSIVTGQGIIRLMY